MKLNYQLLDVFTTEPLKGNQLAVVQKADGLLDDQMQAIAKEFALSEVVFLTHSHHDRITAAARIFYPRRWSCRSPVTSTIGAAVVPLALQLRLSAVRIEERVGTITCIVDKIDKRTAHARFALPQLPEEMGKPPELADIAMALGINIDDIGFGPYRPAVFSAGVPFFLIPVRNTLVLKRLKVSLINWENTFPLGNHSVYCFTDAREEPGVDLAARMFSPGMGIGEDAGTGSAAAALIGLLARHTSFADGQAEYQIRQGVEMGRPCRISVQLKKDAGRLSHGGIGGSAVILGEGTLEFGD